MQKVLDDLKKRRVPSLPAAVTGPDIVKKKTEPETPEDKKPGPVPPLPEGQGEKFAGPVDVMAQRTASCVRSNMKKR